MNLIDLILNVPLSLRLIVLFAIGAIVGGQINRFVYRLSIEPRPIGPWSAPHRQAPPREFLDRVPIIGWFCLRRESAIHGRAYWVRPLLIELVMGFVFAWLYHWETERSALLPAILSQPLSLHVQYLVHCLMISLLVVATFIDFDEQIIPDEITVPGTLLALGLAAVIPMSRLPVVDSSPGAAPSVEPLWLTTPLAWPAWLDGWRGLLGALGIFVAWCIALLPWLIWTRHGLGGAARYFVAHILRPRRRTQGAVTTRPRRPDRLVVLTLAAAVLCPLAITPVWLASGPAWRSLLTALVGLAFGGGLIWAVRVVGTIALQREAMGFGDVTLMAMIGAFLGWQPSLLVFFLAPLSAVLIALIQFVATGRHDIAFGPYLALSTVIVVLAWNRVWNEWANAIFELGWMIPVMVITCVALMGIMLFIWRLLKQALVGQGS